MRVCKNTEDSLFIIVHAYIIDIDAISITFQV
ncbi:MAG: hypothetical protein ACI9ES_001428 [Oceanospirillaceae bacterium]|jgi:hypothetical protein